MTQRTKFQKLLNKLDGTNERTALAISEFEGGVKSLREKLQQEISASTLEEVNLKINKFRKSLDLKPILDGVEALASNFKESILSITNDIETKTAELSDLVTKGGKTTTDRANELAGELTNLKGELDALVQGNRTELNLVNNDLTKLLERADSFATKQDLTTSLEEGKKQSSKIDKEQDAEIKKLQEELEKFKREFTDRLNNRGGGNMNRQIYIGGVDPLKKYTDINLKAGSNVTITYVNNETTKKVDVTIASSGGGGGSTRSVQSISASQTADSASGTDYVYICSGTMTLTMPTASGNSNLYTIKNAGTGVITVLPDGADTLDNDVSIIMPLRYTSVDLISDSVANWNIT